MISDQYDLEWTTNPDIQITAVDNITIDDEYDLNYELVWYLDPEQNPTSDKIWVKKCRLVNAETMGTKDMGYVKINLPSQLDVIFISYNEANAEKNWRRVLEKSPKAYRINGINGIVNAHKCAAELSTTDMFYVVDGDAYLTDTWNFTYQPNIFDRDCVHVWRSINPVNGLEYGYGGVKLLPKQLTLNVDPKCVDMTTTISNKFKLMDDISNITAFNFDEFNTFRSAFRECAKLASTLLSEESKKRLDIWCTTGADKPFGSWAIKGANAGKSYGKTNKDNAENLALINDSKWVKSEFSKILLLNNILSGEI